MIRAIDLQIGRHALELGLITPEQLRAALDEQARQVQAGLPPVALDRVLVESGALDAQAAARLLSRVADADTVRGAAPGEAVTRRQSAEPAPASPGNVVTTGQRAPDLHPSPAGTPAPTVRRIGKYELADELGRGGMGVVYRAWHPGLKTHVALKVLLSGRDASPDEVRRFQREAQASARLQHPGIVAVHDLGEEDGKTWIAMELLEGANLDRVLDDPVRYGIAPAHAGNSAPARRGLQPKVAVRMAMEIAEALQAAHEAGIVHRDLKPANVFRDRHGRLKVMDFGLARLVDFAESGATRSGTVFGTPAYMSPEQAAGNVSAVDVRSDIYQVGAILFELLTGRPPYTGGTPMELVNRVVHDEPPLPRRLDPAIDRTVETICLKAMAREKARRYESARALAEDCARWLADEPILARREAWSQRVARWARRRRAALATTCALALALSVAAGTSWEARRLQRDVLEQASRAVLRYEYTRLSVNLDAAGRRALAQQPLHTLDALLKHQPRFGPLHSWRGTVLALADPTPEERTEAEQELDTGCSLSPESATVWFLRGQYHLNSYQDSRGLPQVRNTADDVEIVPLPPETPEERKRREQGLADLDRMIRVAANDPTFDPEDARTGQALAALYRGGAEDLRQALDLLAGIDRRKAHKGRGIALYLLKRFEEADAALSQVLEDWPGDSGALANRGMTRWSLALRAGARGEDPQDLLTAATADYDEALRRDPGSATPWCNRATAWLALGQCEADRGLDPRGSYAKALADGAQALQLDPGLVSARVRRSAAFLGLAEAESARGCDPREALRQALAELDQAADQKDATAMNKRGIAHLGLGEAEAARGIDPRENYRLATENFDAALRFDLHHADAYSNRGMLWTEVGEWEAARGEDPRATWAKAMADFDAALDLKPQHPQALVGRGVVGARLAQTQAEAGGGPREGLDRALADLSLALKRNPRHVDALLHRGRLLRLLGDAAQAEGKDPRESYTRALADLDEVLRLNPEHAEARGNRAIVHGCIGGAELARGLDPRAAFRKAIADFTEALARNPELSELYFDRGTAHRFLANAEATHRIDPRASYDKAAEDFGEAARRNPENAQAWYFRGEVHCALGDAELTRGGDPGPWFAKAEADLLKALSLRMSQARMRLGLLYRAMGRFDEAVAQLEVAGRELPDAEAWTKARIDEIRAAQRARQPR